MMRWAFNILALLSFLLSVATVVLWVRSYQIVDTVVFGNQTSTIGYHQIHSLSLKGLISINEYDMTDAGMSAGWHTLEREEFANSETPRGFLGIAFVLVTHKYHYGWSALIPHGWLAYIFAGLPILWCFSFYRRRRSKRRLRNNQCVACGYSLQGAVTDVCPECGATRTTIA